MLYVHTIGLNDLKDFTNHYGAVMVKSCEVSWQDK